MCTIRKFFFFWATDLNTKLWKSKSRDNVLVNSKQYRMYVLYGML